jgi:hypothetical protein
MFQKYNKYIQLKYWILKKRIEVKKALLYINKQLWILEECSAVKENGEVGKLAYICHEPSPTYNMNGKKDLSLMSMYHLKEHKKTKKYFGSSVENLNRQKKYIVKNIKLLDKFERIYS